MSRLFCFGLGYSAAALARRLAGRGWRIGGTATTPHGAGLLREAGYDGICFDGTRPARSVEAALATATHVLVSIPPGPDGDSVLKHHATDLAHARDVAWIGYLSTIGVYGDAGGAWVDETCPARPGSERSRRRLTAETAWLAFGAEAGKRVQIFRLAGIYGPGRSAIEAVREGRARRIVKPGQVFNRIHVDDIAATLEAAIARGGRHTVYNVADDEPAPPQDPVAYAARLLGLPVPPEVAFEAARLSDMARSFYEENKRVRNLRIKNDLGVVLGYPTYREGLAAIAAGER